jgi:molecular chaperone GrpE
MIYEQLQSALAGHGVQRIEALGQDFDPHLHDAVEREPSSALPPNVVVAELAKGYQLSGRVLRPAKVRVTVAPATEAD